MQLFKVTQFWAFFSITLLVILAQLFAMPAKCQIETNPSQHQRDLHNQTVTRDADSSVNDLEVEILARNKEREAFLRSMLAKIDQEISAVDEQTKTIVSAQVKLSEQSQAWIKLTNDIINALEDESFVPGRQNFLKFRLALLERLSLSNHLVKTESNFIEFYFGAGAFNDIPLEPQSPQVRETDNESIQNLIILIHNKQIELQTMVDSMRLLRQKTLTELITWNASYRMALIGQRAILIDKILMRGQSILENLHPIKVELKTIYSSFTFHFWQKQYQTKQKVDGYFWLAGILFYLAKLLLACIAIVWLILRKKYVIRLIGRYTARIASTQSLRKYIAPTMEVIKNLYIFCILFILGHFSIQFLLAIGVSIASYFELILDKLIIFFLVLGLIDWMAKLIARRESDNEASAVEVVFEFLPKLAMYYWLISGVVSLTLNQLIDHSLSEYYAQGFWKILFLVILFFVIWIQRVSWRAINQEGSHSALWHKIATVSIGKLWEPVVLFVGGGIGVYRVAWRILLARLIDLELTRSFQAMVNRALLERHYSKSSIKLDPAWFPEKYWRAFNFLTPAEPSWYIPREEADKRIKEIFADWRNLHTPARILLCGDRGIGKSELISKFVRDVDAGSKSCILKIGDSSVSAVCARLGDCLLNDRSLDEEGLVKGLQHLSPSVIVIENLENCLLRQIGGFDAFAMIIDIMLQTSSKHLWLTTCTSHAWIIAKQALIGANNFTDVLQLKGLSEEQIQGLLLCRHNAHSLIVPNFEQLNLEEVKTKGGRIRSNQEKEDKGKEMYFRILWDYTRGNPRQAMYYWKASLSWDGDKTLVKLFDIPDQKVLENLPDDTLMLLAALIEHNGLDSTSLSHVMNSTTANIRRRIEELTPYGMVFSLDNGQNVGWHIESFWTRAIETYLEKRQFLFRGV